jgi:hypothetical protein
MNNAYVLKSSNESAKLAIGIIAEDWRRWVGKLRC